MNDKVSHYDRRQFVYVLAILLFTAVIRIPSFAQPLGPDQGIMSVIGEGILRGELPYKDFWEMASPAIFFTYALIFKVFGTSMAAIPIADTVVTLLSTLIIFLIARAIWGTKVGLLSALFFGFFSNGVRLGMHAAGDIAFGTFWYIAQRETFMLPLIAGSFYFIILPSQTTRMKFIHLFLAGLLAGLAFVYKFPSLIFFLCLLVYVNVTYLDSPFWTDLKKLFPVNLFLIIGFISALVPFVVFFASKGLIAEMTDIIFSYVYSVYGKSHHAFIEVFKRGLRYTFFIAKENFIMWIFFFTSSIFILVNDRSKENLLMILWGLASLLYVVSHKEFFGYHYLVLLPPFSLLTGYGIIKALGPEFSFRSIFAGEMVKVFVILAVFVNLVFFATLNHMHYTKSYYYLTKKISKRTYYSYFNAYPKHDYSFPADYAVSRYISEHTDDDDMIFVLGGIESVIYFLTKRECPSRFIFSWIIFSPFPHSLVERAETYRNEVLGDLEAKVPKYIITVRTLESFQQYAKVYNFINENYVLERKFFDDRFVFVHNSYAELGSMNVALQDK